MHRRPALPVPWARAGAGCRSATARHQAAACAAVRRWSQEPGGGSCRWACRSPRALRSARDVAGCRSTRAPHQEASGAGPRVPGGAGRRWTTVRRREASGVEPRWARRSEAWVADRSAHQEEPACAASRSRRDAGASRSAHREEAGRRRSGRAAVVPGRPSAAAGAYPSAHQAGGRRAAAAAVAVAVAQADQAGRACRWPVGRAVHACPVPVRVGQAGHACLSWELRASQAGRAGGCSSCCAAR